MIQELHPGQFDQVYALMEYSFPENERRSCADQRALLSDPSYKIYTLPKANSDILAFLAVWEFPSVAFLEHFAVSPSYRNNGLGGRLLDELMQNLNRTICLEVEPGQNPLAQRRIAFYQRHGFFLNLYDYKQPSLGPGRAEIVLQLMTSGKAVSPAEFSALRSFIYTNIYHV